MANLTTAVNSILTVFNGTADSDGILDVVTGSPLLLLGVGFFVLGGSIGLVKRLIG